MEAIEISVNEQLLEEEYHTIVRSYLEEQNVKTPEDLTNLIASGKQYYSVLPKDLEEKLIPRSEEISTQIITNWEEKDLESANIFVDRKNK